MENDTLKKEADKVINVTYIAMYVGYCAVQDTQTLISLISSGVEALSRNEIDGECQWQEMDCPGWFTGDIEVCVYSGDGGFCTCGDISREC